MSLFCAIIITQILNNLFWLYVKYSACKMCGIASGDDKLFWFVLESITKVKSVCVRGACKLVMDEWTINKPIGYLSVSLRHVWLRLVLVDKKIRLLLRKKDMHFLKSKKRNRFFERSTSRPALQSVLSCQRLCPRLLLFCYFYFDTSVC